MRKGKKPKNRSATITIEGADAETLEYLKTTKLLVINTGSEVIGFNRIGEYPIIKE